jgi:hypothetical protein
MSPRKRRFPKELTALAIVVLVITSGIGKVVDQFVERGFTQLFGPSEKVAMNIAKPLQSPDFSQRIDYSKDYSQPLAKNDSKRYGTVDSYPKKPTSDLGYTDYAPTKPKQPKVTGYDLGSYAVSPSKIKRVPKKPPNVDIGPVDTSGGNMAAEGAF